MRIVVVVAGNFGLGGDGANGQAGANGAGGAGGIDHGGCDGLLELADRQQPVDCYSINRQIDHLTFL